MFNKYLEIESIPIKKVRNNKLIEFSTQYATSSIEDVLQFVDSVLLAKMTFRHQVICNILKPILIPAIDLGDVRAIRAAIEISKTNVVSDWNGRTWVNLAWLGHSLDVENIYFLEQMVEHSRAYLAYTLHELPAGVLYDRNGASKDKCKELLIAVDEYEVNLTKLGKSDTVLITKCRYHYKNYPLYLDDYKNFKGYADYLSRIRDA